MRKNVAVIVCALALAACSPSDEPASAAARPPLEDWAKSALQPNETLLCVAKHDEDYFYVSRVSPQAMRVGSQLLVKHAGLSSSSTLEAWSFRAPNGMSLLGEEPPKNIRVTNPAKGSPFVESVSEYVVKPAASPTIAVSVAIKRCSDANCKMTEQASGEDKYYRQEVCTVSSS